MVIIPDLEELVKRGLSTTEAKVFQKAIVNLNSSFTAEQIWQWIYTHLFKPHHPFSVHPYLHNSIFYSRNYSEQPAPAWIPTEKVIQSSNIYWLMKKTDNKTYEALYQWSVTERDLYWQTVVQRLNIIFKKKCADILDLSNGVENPQWLKDASLNIVDSCFQAPDDYTAIVYQDESHVIKNMSIKDLKLMVNRIACSLVDHGIQKGDRIAIIMPMTVEAVAVYLGAILAGCAVVTIADSFVLEEIKVRLKIAPCRFVFTQDFSFRGGKILPLYDKMKKAVEPPVIVFSKRNTKLSQLRQGDVAWDEFLSSDRTFSSTPCAPTDFINILFSSGTTGSPKAIPWDHATPIKSAVDGHLHHDIHPGDVVCWPTNLGWMMGPWLVFSALLNRATIALYYDIPTTRKFGQFVSDSGVTMLGLVPSLVSAWKKSGCMEGLDWSLIRTFSSTGESSNAKDMFYLMSLAGYKPIIEYCGGTEIGGGYITGTVMQPCAPGTFTTPALGSEFVVLDDEGLETSNGEVFLIPPAMGLSTQLLNRDHHEVYYANTPFGPEGKKTRRHGDQIERLPNGYYRALGRVDDAMNLGGIKVSSIQIEEVVNKVPHVVETAAIAVSPPEGGPGKLVIYAILADGSPDQPDSLKSAMQKEIRDKLNPLFKIFDVIPIKTLPRTASNKIIRRKLRENYLQSWSVKGITLKKNM